MEILVFFLLAIAEYLIITILTTKIVKLKETVSINYSSFEFSDMGEKPYGLNILIKTIVPTIFMIIAAGVFYKIERNNYVENIYLIGIFYFFIRWVLEILLGRKELKNWEEEIWIFCASTIINLVLYYSFIKQTKQIFISIDELRDAIWISIITFVIVVIRDFIYKHIFIDNEKLEDRKEIYIKKKYNSFQKKYNRIIDTKDKELHAIVYSIMIYENYNRPYLIRMFENVKFLFSGEATLGIMQVNTKKIIGDKTSVKIGYKMLRERYLQKKKILIDNEELVNDVISSYNFGDKYLNEVKYIKGILEKI